MINKINVLVIGYGSIGKRHVNILRELGYHVSVLSRRDIEYPNSYKDLSTALVDVKPQYIVIANETSEHDRILSELKEANFNKKILIEKPIFHQMIEENYRFDEIYVGYNLRFHPIIQKLYKELKDERILSVHTYVGQYLPNWRPDTDYSTSYSSKTSRGGGVIRDLSHELDYLQFLFGNWNSLVSLGGKFSSLKINTDDLFAIIYESDYCPLISLQLNYLDHITQRMMIVNAEEKTYKIDLISNTLQINEQVFTFNVERNETYKNQHIAVINGDRDFLCSYKEGINIVKMIGAIEKSSEAKEWKKNE
ncbi:Gfo/Idh/MocA family protein [Paucisalibacillus globulus]|uniref:Gfo/Idh/MocA family protein n=1 Tax=Paucisalibacillus globulus TaxID=351095 RepID=UPI000418E501|nr:Gfo/Idh/MocA family oxidoreductase [Paucisalibacillus globulus]